MEKCWTLNSSTIFLLDSSLDSLDHRTMTPTCIWRSRMSQKCISSWKEGSEFSFSLELQTQLCLMIVGMKGRKNNISITEGARRLQRSTQLLCTLESTTSLVRRKVSSHICQQPRLKHLPCSSHSCLKSYLRNIPLFFKICWVKLILVITSSLRSLWLSLEKKNLLGLTELSLTLQ